MEYNFSKLWADQFMGFYDFKDLYEYASDEESQKEYYKKLGSSRSNEDTITHNCEISDALLEQYLIGNRKALNVIKNHIIVFLFTRYEFVIQETVKCLICDNPLRIMELLKKQPDYEKTIGFSLVEFLRSTSKEEYVMMMSERLGSRILNGIPSKVIKRLQNLINLHVSDLDILDNLMEKRNQIVHNGKVYDLEMEDLETYYEVIEKLLKSIALALKNIDIIVIDEGQLL